MSEEQTTAADAPVEEAAADDAAAAEAADATDEAPSAEEPAAEETRADEAPAEEEAPPEEPAAEDAPPQEPVAEENAAEEPPAESPAAEQAVAPAGSDPATARVFLTENGYRVVSLWSEPEEVLLREGRHGDMVAQQLYPVGDLPEKVQRALNPLKASKKSS